ncbi:MAG: 4Fe-4S binding protein [Thermoplasmata archaeon]|nr:4Fe-4S binding protein [Thermoplasmata archaeon]
METVKIIKFNPGLCKGHLDCERACSRVHFKTDDGGERSAIRIIKSQNGYQMTNCNHCGLCIDLCPVLALRRLPSGVVILNKNTCIGCQSCVGFCPRGVMRRAPGVIVPFKCISCGACVKACPEGALELVEIRITDVAEEVYALQGVCE